MLTDSKFWIGAVAGIGLYLIWVHYVSKKMKG